MQVHFIELKEAEIEKFPEYLKKYSGKTLIVSLIQESRKLEEVLEVADYIIYDIQDYIQEQMSLEDIGIEVNDQVDLVPSSYKIKVNELDYNKVIQDLEGLEYDQTLITYMTNDNFKLINKPEIIEKSEVKPSLLQKIKRIFIHE